MPLQSLQIKKVMVGNRPKVLLMPRNLLSRWLQNIVALFLPVPKEVKMVWRRDTSWKQGSILSNDILQHLLPDPIDKHAIGIIASHDCDIANDNLGIEPHLECIIAIAVKEDGNFTNAKSSRKLHLPFLIKGGESYFELNATGKVNFDKRSLCDCEPDGQYLLSQENKIIFQDWLASRYRRQAFPDCLDKRLKPLITLLKKRGERNTLEILGYWFSFEPINEELSDGEPYELWVNIVYDSKVANSEEAAKKISEEVEKLFLDGGKIDSKDVILVKSEAYSEEEFTLGDLYSNIHYRFDHVSNKLDPNIPKV